MTEAGLISIRNLGFGYGQHKVISGISLDIAKGEIVGIIGPNGAGKSTFLRLLAGFLKPVEGSIAFRGLDTKAYDKRRLARHMATLPQAVDVPFSYRVEEFILMGRYPHAERRFRYGDEEEAFVSGVMGTLEITHLRGRRIETLSEGERQAVYLAQCIAQDPEVLLLDEPVSHLDIRHQVHTLQMLEDLHSEGLTILMVLHDLNLAAEFSSRIILLARGTVYADGEPSEVLTFENIESAYDTVVIVKENPLSGRPFIIPVSRKYLKK
jgi:iron complex transport system ATP-binding protein